MPEFLWEVAVHHTFIVTAYAVIVHEEVTQCATSFIAFTNSHNVQLEYDYQYVIL